MSRAQPGLDSADIQLQVFQRSFSTKGNGRGLGTYSMKLLTERYLQGEVGFVSTPESGTTFFARFPPLLDSETPVAHSTGDVPRQEPAPVPGVTGRTPAGVAGLIPASPIG
ncbi:MAG: hypothetical protein IPK16_07250 [Anaerolineales bacterium]|nr:hypothetical protein [Anaerolineales bacterium]